MKRFLCWLLDHHLDEERIVQVTESYVLFQHVHYNRCLRCKELVNGQEKQSSER